MSDITTELLAEEDEFDQPPGDGAFFDLQDAEFYFEFTLPIVEVDDDGVPAGDGAGPIVDSILQLTEGYAGMCLLWVRLVFGVNKVFDTAFEAWNGAQFRHPADPDPPAAVPVFFEPSGNGFGHITYSLGDRRVRTTNSATGKIYNTTIDHIATKWGQAYLGWTEDLNGVRVFNSDVAAEQVTDAVEDEMARVMQDTEGTLWLMGPGSAMSALGQPEQVAALEATGQVPVGSLIPVSQGGKLIVLENNQIRNLARDVARFSGNFAGPA